MRMKTFPLILGLAAIMTVGGVAATWEYASESIDGILDKNDIYVGLGTFIYTEDIPDEEVTVIGRLSDILNNQYSNEIVKDSLDYLLNYTILVTWGDNDEQYVGSMDKEYEDEISALFGDVLNKMEDTQVSFLLKEEDLKGDKDPYREIVMYSTSDTLDNRKQEENGVVCVYVTVFTPRVENGNIIGYDLVCDSVRGFCSEICYSPTDDSPSFTTDSWRDGVAHYNWSGRKQSLTGDDLKNPSVYNNTDDGWFDDYTKPDGKTLDEILANEF